MQQSFNPSGKTVGLAILGAGVVGRGVLTILKDQADLLLERTGVTFDVRHVVCRDVTGKNADLADQYNLSTDAAVAVADPLVDIVVEVMGGIEPAATHILSALSAKKSVVTANKALLAERGAELFAAARAGGTAIGFEASCGGGIPIIDALTRGLLGNRIDALVGIVNGTCNFILSQMSTHGWTYADALAEAQRLGYAEADPTLDVNGRDSAQKLSILATLAFGRAFRDSDVAVTGIDELQSEDLRFAGELGYAIKLLAIAERVDETVCLRVHPALVHDDHLMAGVNGSFNAVSVYGHAVGHQFFYGRGAGQSPTASAIVADLLGLAIGSTGLTFARQNVFSGGLPAGDVLPIAELRSRYYLRITAHDEPGVFAQITRLFGEHDISLAGVSQEEADEEATDVPVVVTTHTTVEGQMRAALVAIDALESVSRPTVCIRIADEPDEFADRRSSGS